MTALNLTDVRQAARAEDYQQIYFNDTSKVNSFAKSDQLIDDESSIIRINVYWTTGTVGTCLNHPRQGKTQLFQSSSTSSSSTTTTTTIPSTTSSLKLTIVIILWYLLGVLSITTTKIILRDYGLTGERDHQTIQISPLGMTLQQLFIGSMFLKVWTILELKQEKDQLSKRRRLSSNNNNTKHYLTSSSSLRKQSSSSPRKQSSSSSPRKQSSLSSPRKQSSLSSLSTYYLIMTSIFFTIGFLFTNYSFSSSDATFVETIKASEPMTSALLAYLYKIESLCRMECFSLISICVGVLISTLGNVHPEDSSSSTNNEGSGSSDISSTAAANGADVMTSIVSSGIVMCSNLCFSFRGLYQKLYRNSMQASSSNNEEDQNTNSGNENKIHSFSSSSSSSSLTDYQLQYRIHQMGVLVLFIPFCILEDLLMSLSQYLIIEENSIGWDDLSSYGLLALINAFAFTHYNLASSYVLTRVSVVHHAALNCIRRLFAIVMTSIIFGVPITAVSWVGIFVSIGGFVGFTYYKMQRKKKQQQHQHHHWGVVINGEEGRAKSILPR